MSQEKNSHEIYQSTIGVISIATGDYINYWKDQVTSVDKHLFLEYQVQISLFTDQIVEAASFAKSLSRVEVTVIEIPPLSWPAATLDRYEIFTEHWQDIKGDLIVYLDADMIVASDCGSELMEEKWGEGVTLVAHPGYFRGRHPWKLRVRNPSVMLSDMKRRLKMEAGIGQWERRRSSRAFVPKSARRNYVCGGVWMGNREPLRELISLLARRTQEDHGSGIIARWHDESHLNWWASTHSHRLLPPEYCFDESRNYLQHLQPKIIAVDKGALHR